MGRRTCFITAETKFRAQKQDFFVGNWTLTGEANLGGQKFQFTARFQWMPGEFFLVSNSYSGGKWMELTVIGYDPNEKVFTRY